MCETKIFTVDKDSPNLDFLTECAKIIKGGGIVAFPTETVYGLGGSAFDSKAVERIYEAKNRPPVKALSCLVYDLEQSESLGYITPEAKLLFEKFSPGPLTVVLKKKACVPSIVTAGMDTVGIRFPANAVARELIRLCGTPLATPSANISGEPSPTDGKTVIEKLYGRVDAIIDGGITEVGRESSIVSLGEDGKAKILRIGSLPIEEIKKYVEVIE